MPGSNFDGCHVIGVFQDLQHVSLDVPVLHIDWRQCYFNKRIGGSRSGINSKANINQHFPAEGKSKIFRAAASGINWARSHMKYSKSTANNISTDRRDACLHRSKTYSAAGGDVLTCRVNWHEKERQFFLTAATTISSTAAVGYDWWWYSKGYRYFRRDVELEVRYTWYRRGPTVVASIRSGWPCHQPVLGFSVSMRSSYVRHEESPIFNCIILEKKEGKKAKVIEK